MIIHTESVTQTVTGTTQVDLVKEVVMCRAGPDGHRLGMVRKRLPPPAQPRGAVLLVHGFGQNRYTWHVPGRSFSAYLAAEGWDVFNVDLRGQGRSRMFGSPHSRVLEEYVTHDLGAFADEAARLAERDQLVLIGHSMGGLIAYGAAATSLRGRVRALVSIGSPYEFAAGSRTLTSLTVLLTALHFTGALDRNPAVPFRFIGDHLRRRRRLWDIPSLPMPIRAWLPGSTESEVLDEYLSRAFDVASVHVALDIFRFGRRAGLPRPASFNDYATAFEALDIPLLVLAGTEDHLAPAATVRVAYERSGSSDKTYVDFPLGHIDLIVGRDAPTTVWPTVSRWLGER
jgi:pimeloyl-ACP methyl ester carboxylesterase